MSGDGMGDEELGRPFIEESPASSFLLPEEGDFADPEVFLLKQKTIRDRNVVRSAGQTVLFLSHCWRNSSIQAQKRQIVAALGLNGWSYWADFLDLQAKGPIPWRSEIEDGIRNSAKVVVLIDKEYLLSFNCLQEVAMAVFHGKPIVVIVLEQEAMKLISTPEGLEHAWASLRSFQGQYLLPDSESRPLSLEEVQRLFESIARINFCFCRPLDFDNDSVAVVLRRAHEFVSVEIAYQKEHAVLQREALRWAEHGRDPKHLPPSAAVHEHAVWLRKAAERSSLPPPTELQQQFVRAGQRRATRRTRVLLGVTAAAFAVVTALAIFAGTQWRSAVYQQGRAEDKERAAVAAEAQAQARAAEAREQERVASARQYLWIARGDARLDGYSQAALRRAMAALPSLPAASQVEVLETAGSLGNALFARTSTHPLLLLGAPFVSTVRWVAERWVGGLSPDGRWVACYPCHTSGGPDTLPSSSQEEKELALFDLHAGGGGLPLPLPPPEWDEQWRVVALLWRALEGEGWELLAGATLGWVSSEQRVLQFFTYEVHAGGVQGPTLAGRFGGLEWYSWAWAVAGRGPGEVVMGSDPMGSVVRFDVEGGGSAVLHAWGVEEQRHCDGWTDGTHLLRLCQRLRTVTVWDVRAGWNLTAAPAVGLELDAFVRRGAAGGGHTDSDAVLDAAVAPDGERVVTREMSGAVRVWGLNWTSGEAWPAAAVIRSQRAAALDALFTPQRLLTWSPDSRSIAACLPAVQDCLFHQLPAGSTEATTVALQGQGVPEAVSWGQGGGQVVLLLRDGRVSVAAVEAGATWTRLAGGHVSAVDLLAWGAGDRHFVSLSSADGVARVWRLADGSSQAVLPADRLRNVQAASMNAAGTLVLSGHTELVAVDMSGGQYGPETASVKLGNSSCFDSFSYTLRVAVSHGGESVMWVCSAQTPSGHDLFLAVWQPAAGSLRPLTHPHRFAFADLYGPPQWSPDDRFVAVAGLAGGAFVLMLDVAAGSSELLRLSGVRVARVAAFRPNGHVLAVGGALRDPAVSFRAGEGFVGLVEKDESGGWAFRHWINPDGYAMAVAWAGSGRRLVVASADGTVREWDMAGDCGASWVLTQVGAVSALPNELERDADAAVGLAVRTLTADDGPDHGGDQDALEVLVADREAIVRARNPRSAFPTVHRQSAAVSDQDLEAHYKLDTASSTSCGPAPAA